MPAPFVLHIATDLVECFTNASTYLLTDDQIIEEAAWSVIVQTNAIATPELLMVLMQHIRQSEECQRIIAEWRKTGGPL